MKGNSNRIIRNAIFRVTNLSTKKSAEAVMIKQWEESLDRDSKVSDNSIASIEDKAEPGMQCVICLDQPIDTLFEPCNHICACGPCAAQITTNCPMCRALITATRKIFLTGTVGEKC